jgi:meso-butanediol dehydrogenase / (S,S)-butanediol dehydrogenase / diacetyl reductase
MGEPVADRHTLTTVRRGALMDQLDQPFDDPDLPHRFHGKRAIVTGAASGIGRASAIRLAAEGAQVWCADINGEGAAATAEHIVDNDGTAQASQIDVTDATACQALVAEVISTFGGIDVLCNIAGIGGSAHSTDESVERFNAMVAVNAAGPFYLSQAALPSLLERTGNIVNLASTAGMIGQAYCAAYCASKHALVGITKAMAVEYGRTGMRVNAVCPGGVNTGIIAGFAPPEGASMSLVSRQYLNRDMQEPESVAALIAYVGSDDAYYVNGSIMAIDGGTTVG